MSDRLDRESIKIVVDELLADEIDIFPVGYRLEELIDLDALVSTEAGVTDPLGQLKAWFTDVLNATASWIASTVTNAIQGMINGLWSGVQNLFKGVTNAINALANALTSGFAQVMQAFKTVVLDQVMKAIQSATEFLSKLPSMIASIGNAIQSAIQNAISGLGRMISEAGSKLTSAIGEAMSKLGEMVGRVSEALSDALSRALKGVSDLASKVAKSISGLVQKITKGISEFSKKAYETISGLVERAGGAIKAITEWLKNIGKGLEGLFKAITSGTEQVGKLFSGMLGKIQETFKSWISGLAETFEKMKKGFEEFVEIVYKAPEKIPEALKNISVFIWEKLMKPSYEFIVNRVVKPLFEWFNEHVVKVLTNWFKDVVEKVKSGFEWISRTIQGFTNSILRVPELIWNLLPDWLKDAIETVRKFVSKLIESLKKFLENPEKWIRENVIEPIRKGLEELGRWIWEKLPDWFRDAIDTAKEMFKKVVEELKDFWENPSEWVKEKLEWLASKLWELLPDWLKESIERVKDAIEKFYTKVLEALREFWESPWEFIGRVIEKLWKTLWDTVPDALRDVGEKIASFLRETLDTATSLIKNAITTLWNLIVDPKTTIERTILPKAGQFVESLVPSTTKVAIEWLKGAGKKFLNVAREASKILVEPITAMFSDMFKTMREKYDRAIKEGKDLHEFIRDFFLTLIPYSLAISATIEFTEAAGEEIDRVSSMLTSLLGSVALAGEGAFVRALAHTLHSGAWRILVELPWGLAFWFAESLRKPVEFVMRYSWRNDLPIEIPTISEGREIVQRFMPLEEFSTVRDYYRMWLQLRGFSDQLIGMFAGLPTEKLKINEKEIELAIKIKDRFGQERTFPISLLYDIPTASEMCRMMVKDIFQGLDEFKKAIAMRGFLPGIAFMYYLLHFKYPSPEKLWDFVCRGISGLLWFEPPESARKEAEEETKALELDPTKFAPKAPTELNFDTPKLFSALSTYMKWHDYARFSWIEGFTSDNWIVIDTLADIPTKIDTRWMAKWGIFDFMIQKGLAWDARASEFVKILEDQAKSEKVQMDLRLMCRLLQATGLHPYYVPIVAVAETINALADERTLLRTGLMNLYEYGASDFQSLDDLMASLTTVSFQVAYLDMESGELVPKWINMPVMFLPAERKLLIMRAAMDRYLRIHRDLMHDVERAYTEYIIDKNTGKKIMQDVIKAINEQFGPAIEEISGKKFEMKLDEKYLDVAFKSWQLARDVYTIRRIRSWIYRILGWIIYRCAYGYVTKEDADRLATLFATVGKLPASEKNAISTIIQAVSSIATKEYIPTPSQLATIAEIVPVARKMIKDVIEARRIPPKWAPIWAKYVQIKPIYDDMKSLFSRGERLYTHFMITEEMFEKFLEKLRPYGYEDFELKVRMDSANLERWYRAFDDLVGSPKELVTIAEYSPMARRLALAEVKKRIDALPIGDREKEFLYKMWEDYIRIKPVYDEVRREITELISDYANGVITWEQFERLLDELKKWGIDEWEIDAYKFIARMRRQRYLARQGVVAE